MRRFLAIIFALCLAACAGQHQAPPVVSLVETPEIQVASLPNLISPAAAWTHGGGGATCATNGSDGFAGAPLATPQYSYTIITAYTASAHTNASPWCVAGFDYAVGYASATSLTDWQSISISGVSVNTSTSVVTVSSSNVTLNAIDFSLHNGAVIYVTGSNNTTITNSKFGGSNYTTQGNAIIVFDATSVGENVSNNVMDGAGSGTASDLISIRGGGTATIEYNWFKNYPSRIVQFEDNGGTVTYQFNLIDGVAQASGAHSNALQWGAGTGTPTVQYNTAYGPNAEISAAGEVLQFYGNNPPFVMNNLLVTHNTFMAPAPLTTPYTAYSYFLHGPNTAGTGGGTTLTGTCNVNNNYFDPTNTAAPPDVFYPGSFLANGTSPAPVNPSCTFASNYNMVTGGAYSNTPP
jgi:hypothetical protein